jgi:hypothetical protein
MGNSFSVELREDIQVPIDHDSWLLPSAFIRPQRPDDVLHLRLELLGYCAQSVKSAARRERTGFAFPLSH